MKEKSTCSLVSELKQREGVKQIWVAPYEPYAIHVNGEVIEDSGPANLLVVID
jgi:hypothetical protein